MSLNLSKCHIVGNHMSRLIYLPVYNGDDSEGKLSSMYDMPTVRNVAPLIPFMK